MFAVLLSGWGWMPPSAGALWARKAAGHFQGSVFRSRGWAWDTHGDLSLKE